MSICLSEWLKEIRKDEFWEIRNSDCWIVVVVADDDGSIWELEHACYIHFIPRTSQSIHDVFWNQVQCWMV